MTNKTTIETITLTPHAMELLKLLSESIALHCNDDADAYSILIEQKLASGTPSIIGTRYTATEKGKLFAQRGHLKAQSFDNGEHLYSFRQSRQDFFAGVQETFVEVWMDGEYQFTSVSETFDDAKAKGWLRLCGAFGIDLNTGNYIAKQF